LDCLEVSKGWPDTDSVCFGSVHGDASGGDHKAQEFDSLSVEQTLFRFGVQIVLTKMLQDALDMDVSTHQWVLLGFIGVLTLASAHALHLPTNSV